MKDIGKLCDEINSLRDRWISVDERLPEQDDQVLATYKNKAGKRLSIIGSYVRRWTEESYEDDNYDEYSEEKDGYYLVEGWYEQQDNWDEYSSIFVNNGPVTHWMELPKFTEEKA